MTELAASEPVKQPGRPKLIQIMGPGLITGASDDDPSGIATYSQVRVGVALCRVPEGGRVGPA